MVTLKKVTKSKCMYCIFMIIQASHGPWIVSCYQDLAKQLNVALKHEEKRCQYLSTQAKIMAKEHEEVPSLPEGKLHLLVLLQVLS